MSIICEEIFDEISHPSIEEVREYATRIGIDPDEEPNLLPLATEGLMKALPSQWKPCFDAKSNSYYYYNNTTKQTQWEHPLDDVYRGLVRKVRAESQSLSLNDPTEDATRDDIPSIEETPYKVSSHFPPKKLEPISLEIRKRSNKLAPLKISPNASPSKQNLLFKQKSEEYLLEGRKISLSTFGSFDDVDKEKEKHFDKHPRSLDKTELILGGGEIFLKSNTKKNLEAYASTSTNDQLDSQPKSILRDCKSLDQFCSLDLERNSLPEKSDKDDDDKKSVRFNLDNNTDIGITFSDKSSSEEEINNDKFKETETINVDASKQTRFTVTSVPESSGLKLIKPNPTDFIKPTLTISHGSDSDDDSINKSFEKGGKNSLDYFFNNDNTDDSSSEDFNMKRRDRIKKLEARAERKLNAIKEIIWKEKNDEVIEFLKNLKESQKNELDRIIAEEKQMHEENLKVELEKLRIEMEDHNKLAINAERAKLEESIEKINNKFKDDFQKEEINFKAYFENKTEELEKYYAEKLADLEKELAEKVEKTRDELILAHNSNIEELRHNHVVIIEEVKRQLNAEEQVLRKKHEVVKADLLSKVQLQNEAAGTSGDDKRYEKVRCEKRLLEDKYRCLKEKYIRLKTDVKQSIEKRHKRKEHCGDTPTTTNTTGSETEQSHSINRDRAPLPSSSTRHISDKPPATPKHIKSHKTSSDSGKSKAVDGELSKKQSQDLDTSVSDCYPSDANKNDKNSSDNNSSSAVCRSRKKLFTRLKSSSTSRINNNTGKSSRTKPQRSCSPVENLRRQLQKLEDLEDQFPQNPQSDTYHIRYPFSDGQKFEGSSELEFFRHRIHLERDSIKRAKESLRGQKTLFQQRQKELKLKHGSMARTTLQQLCQEEKELTDMEVSLHRTRSLLGEKVIRLRHLEQSLQRANATTIEHHLEDATLSDLSSHSASSGISSTEFATAEGHNFGKALLRGELQESSEIIQSLENLNSEIRDIWDVLRTQQQQSNIATVIPPLVYADLGWPVIAGTAPPSIPTLADRLHNYRQHVALSNAQSTVVTHAANQGATTTLVERTRNLRHWLRQTGIDIAGTDGNNVQATL